jgi:hypothetical protein
MSFIYVTENKFTGRKIFGLADQSTIDALNYLYHRQTGDNYVFSSCIRMTDDRNQWKLFEFLKQSLDMNGLWCGFNNRKHYSHEYNDRDWSMSIEHFIQLVINNKNLRYKDAVEDVTEKVNNSILASNDKSKSDLCEEVAA